MFSKNSRAISLLSASFIVVLFTSFLVYNIKYITAEKNRGLASISSAVVQTTAKESTTKINPEPPDLTAKSVISIETNLADSSRVVFSKNATSPVPIASITKLMTAVIVLDNYKKTDQVSMMKEIIYDSVETEIVEDGEDEIVNIQSVESMLQAMLISSSNEAAVSLSEKIGIRNFVELMNIKAWSIGMKDTFFQEPSGVSDYNYSTAEDLSKLALHILKYYPEIIRISETKEATISGIGTVENTNQLLGQVPGIIIGKTGFTIEAKECLLLVLYNEESHSYIVNVLLGSDDRFEEMQMLIKFINETI